jgi:small subunit ribosomal protein S15
MDMKERKSEIIRNFRMGDTDTGSVEVQIALLTERINYLNGHFKSHQKDYSSKMGMMRLVGRRRKFLDYLHRHDAEKYEKLLTRLDLRK